MRFSYALAESIPTKNVSGKKTLTKTERIKIKSYDGTGTRQKANSNFGHFETSLGTYNDKPFAMGCWLQHRKAERYENDQWIEV